ncbi:MAG: NAD(+) diphosphatase [Pseudomonadota bacterium]
MSDASLPDGIVTFAGADLDRATHVREDPERLAAALAHPDAQSLPVWRGKPLMRVGETGLSLAWLPADAPLLAEAVEPPIFLGLRGERPCLAHDVSPWEAPDADPEELAKFLDRSRNQHPSLPEDMKFIDLRSAMADLSAADAGNAATARGLFAWHDTHRFCARCGAPSVMASGGWKRECPECGAQHFPRTDPVVIMLILSGNSVLLGRSPGWPEGMYSLLAGFMEPGETIEAAVRRETWEEAGIVVGEVRYMASQPWPFPASLMLGCLGRAETEAIRRDEKELDDAIWLTREEATAALAGQHPGVQPARHGSIARHLLDAWVDGEIG